MALLNKQSGRGNDCGKIGLLVDNAKPHTTEVVRQTLENFRWEVTPHPPYSPDLSPTDYHLFRSLSNHTRGKKFKNQLQLEQELKTFLNSNPPHSKKEAFFICLADGNMLQTTTVHMLLINVVFWLNNNVFKKSDIFHATPQ